MKLRGGQLRLRAGEFESWSDENESWRVGELAICE